MVTLLRPVNSYDGTSLVTVTASYELTFWLLSGLDSGLEVRGVDTVIPGATGRTPRNRVADRRVIEIQGWVKGLGATDALRGAGFRSAMEVLRTLFSSTRSAATLVVGVEDNTSTKSISARPLPDVGIDYRRVPAAIVNINLEAVSPTWT